MSACDKRVVVAADPDYEMKHFNHFVFLLQDFEEKLTDAVLFVPEDGTFFDVGGFN